MKLKHRLSYVEVLIMAFVLGIAARAITPPSAEAQTEEKICILIDGLEVIRANLDLYRAHHGACPPCGSSADFEAALTTKTGKYCPYIEQIPDNPFNNLNTVRFDGEPAGVGLAGWRFDTRTCNLQADNNIAHAAL